jgi:pimeloyl-ACP methyl ester carboxylesterase
VVALDTIALMDALKIQKATLGGFDWGGRTACIIAELWPERSQKVPLPPKAELQWWYQYYFATERGRAGYDKYRHDFSKLIWQIASPKWDFDDATFDRSAASFDNPDHVANPAACVASMQILIFSAISQTRSKSLVALITGTSAE